MSDSNSSTSSNLANLEGFPILDLGDDLCGYILTFVADAPLETRLPRRNAPLFKSATLTCYLPLVCKKFHAISNLDEMWAPALLRQITTQVCWKDGFRRIVLLKGDDSDDDNYEDDVREIHKSIDKNTNVREIIHRKLGEGITCKQVYRRIVESHIRLSRPMFIMPCAVTIGEPYGLHLFEPRYRIMIREVLEQFCDNQEGARRGEPITPKVINGVAQHPCFIHACRNTPHLTPGMQACLVDIARTRVYENGSADVFLMPVAWVQLDRIWTRPDDGHLFCATATRV